jgi:hypothetical protein
LHATMASDFLVANSFLKENNCFVFKRIKLHVQLIITSYLQTRGEDWSSKMLRKLTDLHTFAIDN